MFITLSALNKAESGFWVKKVPEIKNQWSGWADDYCAISVSPSKFKPCETIYQKLGILS